MAKPSAEFFDEGVAGTGAVVAGRRTYDVSDAWGGRGPVPGLPLVVLTHRVPGSVPAGDPPYTFVTDGIGRAVERARAMAGGKNVHLMGASVVQQSIRVGLLDVLIISLVPQVLGRGVRLLDGLDAGTVGFEVVRVIDAPGWTYEHAGDEHGALIAGAMADRRDLEVGDRVTLVPSHIDTTLNLHDTMYVQRDGEVLAEWAIAARGKVR